MENHALPYKVPARRAWLAALCGLWLGGCQTVSTTAPGAVGIERRQVMLVSEADVEESAVQAYAGELKKAHDEGRLNVDTRAGARVQAIAQRLIGQVAVFRPDAAQWKWEVNVQRNDELNAYCMPGGKIMVYSGLIEKLKLDDAELATVLGHEMAHALREHSREAVSRAYGQQIGLGVLGALAGLDSNTLQLAGMVSEVTFNLPRSRLQESEADRIGLELMARAGYDPHAAITLWRKMGAAAQGNTPGFLSTHPASATREADLQALLPRVLPLYQAAKH
ncbi:MAG: hypothetical protein RL684_668 [Pseudomonadota bacterium]